MTSHNLVVVHPLVLLSAVDHYSRVTSQTPNQRVVGVLLGSTYKGRVEVTNSYAGKDIVIKVFFKKMFIF